MARVDAGMKASRQMVHTEARSSAETMLARVVYYVFGVVEVLLALRFVLRLFGANPKSGFVEFIYAISSFFMLPFDAIFKTQRVAGATFEWSALVAIAVYALIAWGIVTLVRAVSPRQASETVERVEQSEDTTSKQ